MNHQISTYMLKINPTHDDIILMRDKKVLEYYDSSDSKAYRAYPYFVKNEKLILDHLTSLCGESVLDIGSGDSFWISHLGKTLDYYIGIDIGNENCAITQKDMSRISKHVITTTADVFSTDYSVFSAETVFLGFFCSHFHQHTIVSLLEKIYVSVRPRNIIILDSFWSSYRKKRFVKNDLRLHVRYFGDDNDCVHVPKRYITHEDISSISTQLELNSDLVYCDDFWCLINMKA